MNNRFLSVLLLISSIFISSFASAADAPNYFRIASKVNLPSINTVEHSMIAEIGKQLTLTISTKEGTPLHRITYLVLEQDVVDGAKTFMIDAQISQSGQGGQWSNVASPKLLVRGNESATMSVGKKATVRRGIDAASSDDSASLVEVVLTPLALEEVKSMFAGAIPNSTSCDDAAIKTTSSMAKGRGCCSARCVTNPDLILSCCGAVQCCDCGTCCRP